MLWNEYADKVREDAQNAIDENIAHYTEEELKDIADTLWVDDSVTGNGSGSYTFNAAEAAENVGGWIFADDARDAFAEWGYTEIPISKGAEWLDVSARCWWLMRLADELQEYADNARAALAS